MTHADPDDGSQEEAQDEAQEEPDLDPPEEEPSEEEPPEDGDEDEGAAPRKRRPKKTRVLHTRVPAVLEQELKRLASSWRMPVSNVVRAILEDALEAVDAVGERAEGGLQGIVERLGQQRSELRSRVVGEGGACPSEPPEALEGALGYQPLVLASEQRCAGCGRNLAAGTTVSRGVFDDPRRRAFLGPGCRLIPGGEKGDE